MPRVRSVGSSSNAIDALQVKINRLLRDAQRYAPDALRRAQAIVTHPRNAAVQFDPVRKAFTVTAAGASTSSTLTGATTQLARVFYPTLVRDDRALPTNTEQRTPSAKKRARTCPVRGGQRHGALVHAGIEVFVQLLRTSPRTAAADMARRGWFDPCVQRFVRAFLYAGLLPVGSEVPVWDEHLGIASRIDVLAVDTLRDQVVTVELKTGYEHAEYNGKAVVLHDSDAPRNPEHWLAAPLGHVPSTPAQRHMLQALLYDLMLCARYGATPTQLVIMRACSREGAVHTYRQSPWTQSPAVRAAVYERLAQARRSGAALERRLGGNNNFVVVE